MFGRILGKKALGMLTISLFLTSILALNVILQPVSAATAGLNLKWQRALGSLGMTYIGPLAADLNHDGKLEVVVVGGSNDGPPTTGAVTVLNGTNGNIIWQVSPANGSAYSGIGMHTPFEIADLDGDGFPEIIVAAAFGVLALRGNNGSVYWRNNNVDAQENYFAVVDVDGDGHPEIFVNRGNGPYSGYDLVTVLDYRGNILRQAWDWHPCWGGLTVADPNNDGHFKIFQGDRSNIYSAGSDPYVGGGQGVRALDAFTLTPIWNDPSILCSTQDPMLANVDNNPNGTLDVVVADQGSDGIAVLNATDGTVLTTRYAPNGSLLPGTIYRKAGLDIPSHSNPTIADVDGDGHLEMIVCHNSLVYIWDLYSWYLKAVLPAPTTVFEPPKVGNVTGNANPDIIVVSNSGIYLYNYLTSSAPTLVQNITAPMYGGSAFTLVQDVDGDGYNELVVTGTGGTVLCYQYLNALGQEFVKSPTPRVRSTNQFYSERRDGSAEYVAPLIPSKPVLRNEYPMDASLNQIVNPTLSILATDFQGYKMNITFSTNMTMLASYTNVPNGLYSAPTTNMNSSGSTYYWIVTATDGNSTTSNAYKFTTYPSPQTQNSTSSANLYLPFDTPTSSNPLVGDTLFSDGFESGSGNWTGWVRSTSQTHSGFYSMYATLGSGYLTSNSLDTSSAEGIIVSFWYYDHGVGAGDNVYLQFWNGSTYIVIFQLGNAVPQDQWRLYSYQTYDRQYLTPGFNIRFNAWSIKSSGEGFWIDDVSVTAPSRTLDYSGYHNDGTVHSATWTSQGVVGGAYIFDGINDYIRIQDQPSLGGDGTWSQISIEFWINPLDMQKGATIVAKKFPSSTYGSYKVGFSSSGSANTLSWGISSTSDNAWHEINSSGTVLPVDQWSHVVCEYKSGTGLSIYVNDILVASSSTPFSGNIAQGAGPRSGVPIFGRPMFIGWDGGSGRTGLDTQNGWLNAILDDVRVYPSALSPSQKWNLTVVSVHGNPSPGVGNYFYDDSSSVTCSVSSPVNESNVSYTCIGWTGTGSIPSSGSGTSVTFTLTQNSTITWNWIATPQQYGLIVGVSGSGTTNATGSAMYTSGTVVAVNATPQSGWTLNYWLLNGTNVGSANPYVLTINQNYNLTAVFVFADGFESGNFTIWNGSTASAGETASVGNTLPHSGVYSAIFASNGGGGSEYAYCFENLASPMNEVYARGYFYVNVSGITANDNRFYFITLRAGSNTLAYAGWRMTGGSVKWNLLIRNGAGYVDSYSVSSPVLGQWYSVELHWVGDSVNGHAELYVNGALVCSIAGQNTANYGGASSVRFGLVELYNCGPTTVYGDDGIIATAYIGPMSQQATVNLDSRETGGSSISLGSIIFDSITYGLPANLSKATGLYTAQYLVVNFTYIFDHWEVSGQVLVSDANNSTTNVTVSGNGTLTAVYKLYTPYIFSDGFESGDLSAWSGNATTSGDTASVVGTLPHSGAFSADFATNGNGGYENDYCYDNTANLNEVYARGYFYVNVSGITANDNRFYFITLRAGSNTLAYAGWRMTGGSVKWNLLIRNGAGYVDSYSVSSPVLGQWYSVELHWVGDSVNGHAELYVNGALVCSIAGQNTANYGGASSVRFGLVELYNCGPTTVYFDDCVLSLQPIGP